MEMTKDDEKTTHKEQKNELKNQVIEQKEEPKKERSNELFFIDPKELNAHEVNVEIYGEEDIDETLLESIRTQGQLDPIMTTQHKTIISGHRRWKVLLKLKEEETLKRKEGKPHKEIVAICLQKYYNDLLEEKEAIVEFNRQRKKNPLQLYKEIELLEDVYSEYAKLRKYRNLPNANVPDLEHLGESGRTVQKEARVVGLSEGTIGYLKYIGKKTKEKNNLDAEYVMNEMVNDRLSIDAGYKLLKLMEAAKDPNARGPRAQQKDKEIAAKAQILVDKIKKGTLTSNKAEKDFGNYKKNYDSTTANAGVSPRTEAVLPEGSFNVFVLDPKGIEEAEDIIIPNAKDAAMFLWATTNNLKERLELMQFWSFNLKSIGIWNTGKKSSEYFDGFVEFLLIGIKGNLKPAEDYRPNIIFKKGYKDKENKSEIVYEIAEKMFPGQHYLDLCVANNRENWGQPIFKKIEVTVKVDSKVSTDF
jgi:N6-adenosine-specific RNA methylase IME4